MKHNASNTPPPHIDEIIKDDVQVQPLAQSTHPHISKRRVAVLLCCGVLALFFAMLAGLLFGTISLQLTDIFTAFTGGASSPTSTILLHHRLPRVLMACTVGAALSLAGLCFQTILRNPLAEPYILGISGGAAVGTILAMLLGFSGFMGDLGALIGSLTVLALVLLFSSARKDTQSLLLSGVMLNAFCGAIILFLISLAQPSEISTIMFWFMGNLSAATLNESLYMLSMWGFFVLLIMHSHSMNLLLLGKEAAQSLGLGAERTSLFLLIVTSFIISIITAKVGPLGFVGIVIPQALRLVAHNDNRLLSLCCVFYGGAFLTLCDLLARILPAQGELPVGVITALIGAPIFILLQRRQKGSKE